VRFLDLDPGVGAAGGPEYGDHRNVHQQMPAVTLSRILDVSETLLYRWDASLLHGVLLAIDLQGLLVTHFRHLKLP
jgi:hypothetical protein